MHLTPFFPALSLFLAGSIAFAATPSRKPVLQKPAQPAPVSDHASTPVQTKEPVSTTLAPQSPQRESTEAKSAGEGSMKAEFTKPGPPPFSRRFGMGLSAVPVQVLLFPQDGRVGFVYTGGMQLDFYGRLHPLVTLEFSLAGLGWKIPSRADISQFFAEFSTSLGTRLFFYRKQVNPSFSIHPYVVTALRLHTQVLVIHESPLYDLTFHQVLFGFVPGIGIEFRWKEKLGFHIDARTFVGTYLYPLTSNHKFITGISSTLGISYFF